MKTNCRIDLVNTGTTHAYIAFEVFADDEGIEAFADVPVSFRNHEVVFDHGHDAERTVIRQEADPDLIAMVDDAWEKRGPFGNDNIFIFDD